MLQLCAERWFDSHAVNIGIQDRPPDKGGISLMFMNFLTLFAGHAGEGCAVT